MNPILSEDSLSDFFFHRALAGRKIGRAVTSRSSDELGMHVDSYSRHLGGSDSWTRHFAANLKSWVQNSGSHQQATEALSGPLSAVGLPEAPRRLLAAAQLCGALGLHVVSLELEVRAWDVIESRAKTARHRNDLVQQIQVAIYRGDMTRALNFSEKLKKALSSKQKSLFSYIDLLNYVSVWAGAGTLTFPSARGIESQTSERWNALVTGQKLYLYGPGTVGKNEPAIPQESLVMRIAGPGSYRWGDNNDLALGRTDIVHIIPETLADIGDTDAQKQEIFGGYEFVCIKRSHAPYLPNSRKVEAGSRLFLRGHPNVVPLMCIDALRVPGTSLRVLGSDFFASPVAYRSDSRREGPGGVPQNSSGSTGHDYDRSTLMASHNAFENRALVKNLHKAGRIEGDYGFEKALALSDFEYAQTLDEIYGTRRG